MLRTSFISTLVGTLLLVPSSSFTLNSASKPIASLFASPSDKNSHFRASAEEQMRLEQPLSDELNNDAANEIPVDMALDVANNSVAADRIDPDDIRSCEFHNIQPVKHSVLRKERLELETRLASMYTPAGSDEYWELRDEIMQLEADLEIAKSVLSDSSRGRGDGIKAIESMLRRKQAKDPEHVYRVTTAAARVAQRMGRLEEAERYKIESQRAKKMLPQFNLEGLWVGKYGSHGFEMINITYVGDELIAYKVTGDQNIPRGEVTFTADLSLSSYSSNFDGSESGELDPIILSEASAKKWGTKRLPRYPGRGHAAEPGYQNPQYLDGQLVVIGSGDYFSFAWIPLEHQIFFGRPSPELTLKMLRDGGSSSLTAGTGRPVPSAEGGNTKEMTDYISRCLEVTMDTFWDEKIEGKVSEWSGIWHGNDDEYCYFQ
jgi:hypothetical protein